MPNICVPSSWSLPFSNGFCTLSGSDSLRHEENPPMSATAAGTTQPITITDHEMNQVDRANKTGLQPVVFVHGLWLLPSSWDRWAAFFEEAGFTALTPGWPDDPETVAEANANPDVLAHKTVGQVADHFEEIVRALTKKPAII